MWGLNFIFIKSAPSPSPSFLSLFSFVPSLQSPFHLSPTDRVPLYRETKNRKKGDQKSQSKRSNLKGRKRHIRYENIIPTNVAFLPFFFAFFYKIGIFIENISNKKHTLILKIQKKECTINKYFMGSC